MFSRIQKESQLSTVGVHSHTSIFRTPPAEESRSLNVPLDEMLFRLRMSFCGHTLIGMMGCLSLPHCVCWCYCWSRSCCWQLKVGLVIVMRIHTPYDYQQFCKYCSLHGAALCIRKNALIYIVSGGMANKTCSLIVFPVIIYFSENFLCVTLPV